MFFRFWAWLLRSAYLVTKPFVRSGTEGPCCVPGHPKAVGCQSGSGSVQDTQILSRHSWQILCAGAVPLVPVLTKL